MDIPGSIRNFPRQGQSRWDQRYRLLPFRMLNVLIVIIFLLFDIELSMTIHFFWVIWMWHPSISFPQSALVAIVFWCTSAILYCFCLLIPFIWWCILAFNLANPRLMYDDGLCEFLWMVPNILLFVILLIVDNNCIGVLSM